jgi:hypothetical protein
MKTGDLVEIYRNPESNPIEEPSFRMGILVGYDTVEKGWDIFTENQIECFPDEWWKCERLAHENR